MRFSFRLAHRLILGAGVAWGPGVGMTTLHAEEADEEAQVAPVHISREANGLVVLTLDSETQDRIALSFHAAKAATVQPTVVAYGRLEPDPAGSFTLRAPIAGVLRKAPEQAWPEIGSAIEARTVLGFVEPRFTPSEMVDLHARWMEAQAEVNEINADLEAARTSFESKSRLNAERGLVSDRSMEEASVRYKRGEVRHEAAAHKAEMYEALIKGQTQSNTLFPIEFSENGQAVEVSARPGEVVDAGQVILRTARLDVLIAQVALSVGEEVESPLPQAPIMISGGDSSVLVGEPIGPAPTASPVTGGQTLLYRVRVSSEIQIRPGAAVIATIPMSGEPLSGVLIPRSAVLRYSGRTWVYVKAAEDRFERRDCVLHGPTADGWVATSGVSPGEEVVVEGAQMLLSEELKSQIESEAEAEE